MNLMGYDGMAIGPEELALGPQKLAQRIAEADFPVLSANLVSSTSSEPVAKPFVVLEVNGHRLGVLGLTRQPDLPVPGFEVRDAASAAAEYLPEVAEQASTIILLTNLAYRDAVALADEVAGIDLIIAALPDQLPKVAVRTPRTGALVVTAEQATPRHSGRRVGRLSVTLGSDGRLGAEQWESVWMDASIADDPLMAQLIQEYTP